MRVTEERLRGVYSVKIVLEFGFVDNVWCAHASHGLYMMQLSDKFYVNALCSCIDVCSSKAGGTEVALQY